MKDKNKQADKNTKTQIDSIEKRREAEAKERKERDEKQALVSDIRADFERRSLERRPLEAQWQYCPSAVRAEVWEIQKFRGAN